MVGYVPGFPVTHSQDASLNELHANLRKVIEMLLEDGEPALEGEFGVSGLMPAEPYGKRPTASRAFARVTFGLPELQMQLAAWSWESSPVWA